jgi:hypothetical protein
MTYELLLACSSWQQRAQISLQLWRIIALLRALPRRCPALFTPHLRVSTPLSKVSFMAMAQHLRLSDIHTCILCSAQEIDPLAKSRGTNTFIIKYRGSRVFRGRNDCTFFSHIFGNLTSEWNDCSNDCFDLDLWIYELTISILNNQDSRLACGLWRSTVDDVILSPESFGILALPGKQRWTLLLQNIGRLSFNQEILVPITFSKNQCFVTTGGKSQCYALFRS